MGLNGKQVLLFRFLFTFIPLIPASQYDLTVKFHQPFLFFLLPQLFSRFVGSDQPGVGIGENLPDGIGDLLDIVRID